MAKSAHVAATLRQTIYDKCWASSVVKHAISCSHISSKCCLATGSMLSGSTAMALVITASHLGAQTSIRHGHAQARSRVPKPFRACTPPVPSGPCIHRRLRQQVVLAPAASSSTDSGAATTTDGVFSLSLPTRDARSSISLSVVPDGKGQAILVSGVEAGSSAELAGVRPGLRLRGISDPIRDEVWPLQDRPSLRYVRETLRMRRAESIEMQFESSTLPLPRVAPDGTMNTAGGSGTTVPTSTSSPPSASSSRDGSNSVLNTLESFELGGDSTTSSNSSTTSSSGSGDTIADRLQAQYEEAQKEGKSVTAVQERIQRRQAVMDEMDQRNDSGFLLLMFAAFVVPPLVIILVAYETGYLDHIYNNALTLNG